MFADDIGVVAITSATREALFRVSVRLSKAGTAVGTHRHPRLTRAEERPFVPVSSAPKEVAIS
jgi:hypothetical protein